VTICSTDKTTGLKCAAAVQQVVNALRFNATLDRQKFQSERWHKVCRLRRQNVTKPKIKCHKTENKMSKNGIKISFIFIHSLHSGFPQVPRKCSESHVLLHFSWPSSSQWCAWAELVLSCSTLFGSLPFKLFKWN
jgi:hypothetical protein